MGRYYSGDIEGKFWFAVQSSDAADRFGVTGQTPNYLTYYFDESNIDEIKEELKRIEESLGEQFKLIKDFFENNNGYNDEILKKNNIDKDNLSEYADYLLGEKILKCVEENGQCSFDAEL
jgi:hypothetical protein